MGVSRKQGTEPKPSLGRSRQVLRLNAKGYIRFKGFEGCGFALINEVFWGAKGV